jgi:hypothetical protein
MISVDTATLPTGSAMEVHTNNNVYVVVRDMAGGVLVSGHPEYCPQPVSAQSIGSVLGDGSLSANQLATGARMTFVLNGRRINTSRIVEIRPYGRV